MLGNIKIIKLTK